MHSIEPYQNFWGSHFQIIWFCLCGEYLPHFFSSPLLFTCCYVKWFFLGIYEALSLIPNCRKRKQKQLLIAFGMRWEDLRIFHVSGSPQVTVYLLWDFSLSRSSSLSYCTGVLNCAMCIPRCQFLGLLFRISPVFIWCGICFSAREQCFPGFWH